MRNIQLKVIADLNGKRIHDVVGPVDQRAVFSILQHPQVDRLLSPDNCSDIRDYLRSQRPEASFRRISSMYYAYNMKGGEFQKLGEEIVFNPYGVGVSFKVPEKFQNQCGILLMDIKDLSLEHNLVTLRQPSLVELSDPNDFPAIAIHTHSSTTYRLIHPELVRTDGMNHGLDGILTISVSNGQNHGSLIYDNGKLIAQPIWHTESNVVSVVEK